MKGIVFCEFAQMVAAAFDEDMVDNLIDETAPASGGAYTAVGTYDHSELVAMIGLLADKSGSNPADLVRAFGRHMAVVFAEKYAAFFDSCPNTIEFLKTIDNHIHVEVRKLYSDAELPVFDYDDSDADKFQLIYKSSRGFADLARGLIEGCATHYGESFDIGVNDQSGGAKQHVVFTLTRQ